MVEERYTPLFTAVREVGNLLRSKDVLEYPGLVKKLKKKANRDREQANQAILLALEQKEELRKKKEYIRKMEDHIRKQEQQIQKQEQLIQRAEETDRTCITKVVRLFQPEGEVQTKARLYD